MTRTVDDKHKTAFDELSNAKNEEIAASTQQHKEKSLEDQETKLSNDRKTAELERTQESLGEQEAFLANLNPTTYDARHAERLAEIQTIAESIEIRHENENQVRDHFSKTNISIAELDAARTTAKTLAMQLKKQGVLKMKSWRLTRCTSTRSSMIARQRQCTGRR